MNETNIPRLFRDLARSSSVKGISTAPPEYTKFMPVLIKYLSVSSVPLRSLSQLAWSLDRMRVYDELCWSRLVSLSMVSSNVSSGSDVAVFVFSLANSVSNYPSLVSRSQIRDLSMYLASISATITSKLTLCDCAQLTYGVSVLFPHLVKPLLLRAVALLEAIPKGADDIPQLESCNELLLLWSVARVLGDNNILIPSLLETSRGLRLCHDFNQYKASQLCECISKLEISDPRVISQIIHYVDINYASINARNLLRIIQNMANIDNPILWKQISKRLEQPVGLKFSLDQIEAIKSVYKQRHNGRRTLAILELYQKTKLDAKKFGPA